MTSPKRKLTQKLLRKLLCCLYLVVVVFQIAVNVIVNFNTWGAWLMLIAATWLLIIYCYSVRANKQVQRMMRAIPILALTGFLLVIQGRNMKQYIEYRDSTWCLVEYGKRDVECAIVQTWTSVSLLASCLTIFEVVLTLIVGPLNAIRPTVPGSTEIQLVSPLHPTVVTQPDTSMPYGGVHPPPYPTPSCPDSSGYPAMQSIPTYPMPPSPQHQQPYPQYPATITYGDGSPPPSVQPDLPYQPYQPYAQHHPYLDQNLQSLASGTYILVSPVVEPRVPQLGDTTTTTFVPVMGAENGPGMPSQVPPAGGSPRGL